MSNQYVQTQVVCANCAAIRGETNHWWLIDPRSMSITIRKWRDGAEGGDFLPACGELCLLRLVAKNLEKL